MAWITDMVVMTDEHKMIFSSIDNSLGTAELPWLQPMNAMMM